MQISQTNFILQIIANHNCVYHQLLSQMQLTYTSRFFNKNFYKDIGLSSHFTFKGFIKRIRRKYPTADKGVRIALITTVSTFFWLGLLPGSILPMQKQFKLYMMSKAYSISAFWYLSNFNPDPIGYLLSTEKISDYGWNQRILNLAEINEILDKQLRIIHSQNYMITERIRVQIIFNFVNTLSKMLERDACKQQIIDKKLKTKYETVMTDVIVPIRKSDKQLSNSLKPFYILSFKIFQYLLKNAENTAQRTQLIRNIYEFIKIKNNKEIQIQWAYLPRQLSKQTGLKSELKRILASEKNNKTLRSDIMNILNEVNLALSLTNEL